MIDLRGQVALITGGGRGLGAAIARVLAEAGAVVVPADVREELAGEVAESIRSAGGEARPLRLDVTDAAHTEAAIRQVAADLGRLDVLVNNAGVDVTVSIEELSVADWQRILEVNLSGPFLTSRVALPLMREQGRGHIVNIVSTAAKRAWANASAYHASKWGLLGFSHALHVEARPHGVKVTAIIAGGMRTPFLLDRFPDTRASVPKAITTACGSCRPGPSCRRPASCCPCAPARSSTIPSRSYRRRFRRASPTRGRSPCQCAEHE